MDTLITIETPLFLNSEMDSNLTMELHKSLYVPYFLCRVGLSFLSCRPFYKGAQR